MPDEAVNGDLNQWMQGRGARVEQMVLTIDPKHAHTLPLTNDSILDLLQEKLLSLCVCLQGATDTLELKYAVCLT